MNSGDKLSEEGKLLLKVSDEAGNSSEAEITLTRTDSEAPRIEVLLQEKNVIAGVKVSIQDNQLLFDDVVAATWTDDYSTTFTTVLTLVSEGGQSKALNSGDMLFDAGKLSLTVADESNNNSTAEIPLTAIAITGLENLQNLTLQVDQEVNLLQGLTIAEGLKLSKVEIEADGGRSVLPNPNAYTPEYPGVI